MVTHEGEGGHTKVRPASPSLEDQREAVAKLLEANGDASLLETLMNIDNQIAQRNSATVTSLDQELIDEAMWQDEY